MATTVNKAFDEFMKDIVNLDPDVVSKARESRDNLLENIAEFDLKGIEIKVKTTAEFRENIAAKVEQPQIQESVSNLNLQNATNQNITSEKSEPKISRFGRGVIKSFLKKRKKHFHKINAVPNYVDAI